MSEEYYKINHKILDVFCICIVLTIIGFFMIVMGFQLNDLYICIIIGVIILSIPITIFVDYGLHKLWHSIEIE